MKEENVALQCPVTRRAWQHRKLKMENVSRWIWETKECSLRTNQFRKSTLKEFWEIFVYVRPFGKDSTDREANVQSKAVLSCAMTLMDKIRGGKTKRAGWGPSQKKL